MYLYEKKYRMFMMFGILFINFLSIGLCCFFMWRYLYVENDPLVFVLIVFFAGGVMAIDFGMHQFHLYDRVFLKCKIDAKGLHCRCLGKTPWFISWDDIHTYGVTGVENELQLFGIVFFSTDPNERYDKKKIVSINRNRLTFQDSAEFRAHFDVMPADVQKRLQDALNNRRDLFLNR